jgi:FkbM family methyltransferase
MLKRQVAGIIKRATWKVSRNKLGNMSRSLKHLAEMYLDQYYDHFYEFNSNGEAHLVACLKQLDIRCVFDVGANVGHWSNMALDAFPLAAIHAFELSERTYKSLVENAPSTRVTKNKIGLSDQNGPATFKQYKGRSELSTIIKASEFWDEAYQASECKCMLMTGDEYCDSHGIDQIDLLKIDAEGAEYFVISGFDQMVRQKKIRLIQFEYGYTNADAGHAMRQFFTFFNERGYIVGKLWSDGVEFTKFFYWLNNYKSGPNFVAVNSDDLEVINAVSIKREPVFASLKLPLTKRTRSL